MLNNEIVINVFFAATVQELLAVFGFTPKS